MASNESVHKDSSISEFTSILLDVSDDIQDLEEDVVSLSNNSKSAENKNLNSILTQIQDDGPAGKSEYSEAISHHDNSAESYAQKDTPEQVEAANEIHNEFLAQAIEKKIKMAVMMGNSVRGKVIAALSITLVIILTAVNIELRTSFLEQAFEDFSTDFQARLEKQGESFHSELAKINMEMRIVHSELQSVKEGYSDVDKRYGQVSGLESSSQIAAIQQQVKSLMSDFLSLKSELATVKNSQPVSKNDTSDAVRMKKNAKQQVASTAVTVPTPAGNPSSSHVPFKTVTSAASATVQGVVVNLVSLSNSDAAAKLVKDIYESGFSPSIQQATVNSRNVYRISVRGFDSEEDAKQYIRDAGKKYGIYNSRISKG